MHKERYLTQENLSDKRENWLEKLRGLRGVRDLNRACPLENSALLVIDMQAYFTNPVSHAFVPSTDVVIHNINKLVKCFNRKPVIYTKHIDEPNTNMIRWWNTGLYAGTEFSSIESGVKVSGEILVKHTYSAFHGTNLHENLQHSHIENLYIAGVLTNLCCETTARDAFLRNYNVFFVADATATYREDMHIATLLNLAHGFARIVFTGDIVEGCENGL